MFNCLGEWVLNETGRILKTIFIVARVATIFAFISMICIFNSKDKETKRLQGTISVIFGVAFIGTLAYTAYLFFSGALGAILGL